MEIFNDLQEDISTEHAFEAEPVPSLSETITPRSLVFSFIIGATLSVVAMKVTLSSGFILSLSIPAGLLGFYVSRAWIRILDYFAVSHLPFTRQENTIIQTCVVACTSVTFTGGFGTYILAMSKKAAGGDVKDDNNIEEPSIAKMITFLFLISFAGMFIIMPFRKIMIIRHRLTYPSGTATAHLINSFHTPQGVKQARNQVTLLFKSFGGTMAWSFFQWFFASGPGCGFKFFPTFGLEAYKHGFFFDFSMANVGIGMMCPYMIVFSMLIGSIISWCMIWPYIQTKEGIWYPSNLGPDSLSGIRGYKVLIGLSMILADCLFVFLSIMVRTACAMVKRRQQASHGVGGGGGGCNMQQPFQCLDATDRPARSFDDRRRAQVFLRDEIPNSVAIGCYVLLSVVSIVAIPLLYPQLRYHHVALIYLAAPIFAFCNAYGCGVTDINLGSTYCKIAMLVFGSWIGVKGGGVIAALVAGGIMVSILGTAADLTQDLKTGYLTLTSPRAVFISEVIGMTLGCIINPTVFWAFYKMNPSAAGGDMSDTPYAKLYRGFAMLSVGEEGLPGHSMFLCKLFFALAMALSAVREVANRKQWRVRRYIPSTIGMAVAFIMPPRMPVGMAVGSLVAYLWEKADAARGRMLSPAMASGFICGDGLGSLLLSTLTLVHATAPICIKFLARGDNDRLDAFLATLPAT
ncbi:probable metal-nicotianamine transporter YSL7 [Oryza brachyantha]|uniref:Metal-nicotianamine transporter YSL7 n=1 Tax=Oryza brachyantha TaxID=4533 RepID=J3L8Y3_ORYBR|nr:probable metal-nicotianamine transporter YSL7 [Oryza brachyantha]